MRFLFVIAAAIVIASATDGAVVRLKENAETASPIVTLADVAEVLANDPHEQKRLERIELGPAPEAGASIWLDVSEIKDRLYRGGVRLDEVEFAGSRRVEVRQVESPRPATAPMGRTADDWRREIAALIHHSARNDLGEDPAIRVRVEGDRAADFLARNPNVTWEILAPARWQEGWQPAELLIAMETQTSRFPLHVEILPVRPVVAARRPIARGTKIEGNDLTLVSLETSSLQDEFLFDTASATGMEAKRDLPAGKPIAARDVRPIPVVFRGEPITVQIRFRTAWLQKTFLAGQDGGVGEWIEAHDPDRRDGKPHEYMVRVTGPHAAELPPDAPRSAMAARNQKTSPARAISPIRERNAP